LRWEFGKSGRVERFFFSLILPIFVKKHWIMTQIVLEIPRRQDLDMLLTLFKRLNIKVVQRVENKPKSKSDEEDVAMIVAGLPPRQDFEAYVQEFEESRKDKMLPLREN
jgi:hypothetical protein